MLSRYKAYVEEKRMENYSDSQIAANLINFRRLGILNDEVPVLMATNISVQDYEAGINLFLDKSFVELLLTKTKVEERV